MPNDKYKPAQSQRTPKSSPYAGPSVNCKSMTHLFVPMGDVNQMTIVYNIIGQNTTSNCQLSAGAITAPESLK